jgi:hypothetical protein
MSCSTEAGIKCVPISPLVLAPQIKKLPISSQKSRERALAQFLAADGQFLYLRGKHQRLDRHAPDTGLGRA